MALVSNGFEHQTRSQLIHIIRVKLAKRRVEKGSGRSRPYRRGRQSKALRRGGRACPHQWKGEAVRRTGRGGPKQL